MSNITKFFNDSVKNTTNDSATITSTAKNDKGLKTKVIFKSIDTGKTILETENRVVIAGSQFTAMKHFNLPELIALPTYNQDLILDNSIAHGTTPENIPIISLFACGTAGCGEINSQVYPVHPVSRINPVNDLIPFRYQLPNNDLTPDLRGKYFGRKTLADRIAYYFKAFEAAPQMFARYVDGTIIDANAYANSNTSDAEFYVEMNMRITKEDFRDYFRATTGINDAKVNSLSLLTAWYSEQDGYRWYQDIIPMTRLNIPNEPLIDLTKGIDIIYHIYY